MGGTSVMNAGNEKKDPCPSFRRMFWSYTRYRRTASDTIGRLGAVDHEMD